VETTGVLGTPQFDFKIARRLAVGPANAADQPSPKNAVRFGKTPIAAVRHRQNGAVSSG
jgi:hypothetical protein